MNRVKINGISFLLPARWSDITDRAQFVDICRALYEFETGITSFDEFRLGLALAALRLQPSKLRNTETLQENLFRISELLDFPYTITEQEDGLRTAVINIRLEQNLLPEVGGITGYRYVTDAAGVVDTTITAQQYIEALSLLQLFGPSVSKGSGVQDILDNLVQTLYPGAKGYTPAEAMAVFYNYRGIMATIASDPDYDLLFHTQPSDNAPSPAGPQAAIFALSKAGYGNIESVRNLDVYTYLAALTQQTIDSIRALSSAGMKTGEIASRLSLTAEQVAPYITK